MGGVTEVEILEDHKDQARVVRKMVLNHPKMGPMVIIEDIQWDEPNRLIVFKIIEHPSHTGQVINRVDVKGENEYELTYEMDWKFKGEGEDPMDGTVIKGAVIKSVQIIEAA